MVHLYYARSFSAIVNSQIPSLFVLHYCFDNLTSRAGSCPKYVHIASAFIIQDTLIYLGIVLSKRYQAYFLSFPTTRRPAMAKSVQVPTAPLAKETRELANVDISSQQGNVSETAGTKPQQSTTDSEPSTPNTRGIIVGLARKIAYSENMCSKLLQHNRGLLAVLDEAHPMATRFQLDHNIHRDGLQQALERVRQRKESFRKTRGSIDYMVQQTALQDELTIIKDLEQHIDALTSKLVSATRPSTNQMNHGRIARSLS